MKIISWNTNGLRATVKNGDLMDLFTTHKADIVCLQEVKAELDQLPEEVIHIQGYEFFLSHCKTRKGYSGVSVYTKINPSEVMDGFGVKEFDDEGRTNVLIFDDVDHPFVLMNCYFPNGGGGPIRLDYKMRFYDAFLKKMEKYRKEGYGVIVCGDVNTAHHEIDLARPKENKDNTGFLPQERAWIDKVVSLGYIDTFRTLHPDTKDSYTYWDQKTGARTRNVGWRIDYFFISPDLLPYLKKSEHLTDYMGSDHCPIFIDIAL